MQDVKRNISILGLLALILDQPIASCELFTAVQWSHNWQNTVTGDPYHFDLSGIKRIPSQFHAD